jgi:hypothetical protein
MKAGKLFTSTNQPTFEQRCDGQKTRQWRMRLQKLVFGSQLELFLNEKDLKLLYQKSKFEEKVSFEEFKKLEVNHILAKHLINYMTLCKNIPESKNALEVIKTLAPTAIDELSDRLPVQINVAENETLKCESTI